MDNQTLQPTSDPKLQAVSYVTILPEGKQSGYKPRERIDYKINATETRILMDQNHIYF